MRIYAEFGNYAQVVGWGVDSVLGKRDQALTEMRVESPKGTYLEPRQWCNEKPPLG